MTGTGSGPPPPPPLVGPSYGRLGRLVRGPLGIVAVVVVWSAFSAAAIWAFFFWDRSNEFGFVYARYNDAIVAGDVDAAWGLGCRRDRERVPVAQFERLVERSVRPLGELESWSRLRGGPEWHGTRRDEQRRPEIVEEDGHHCVRFGENALGERF